jgi:hypothetical protein
MSTITESVDVDVDVATAYNQWTQFESFPKFMEGVEEIRQLDDTHIHWKIKIAGTTRVAGLPLGPTQGLGIAGQSFSHSVERIGRG